MDVAIHVELGEIDSLGPAWGALVAADPHASLFQTPEYAHVWWEEFGALRSLALLEIPGEGTPVGVAPLMAEPDGRVRFLGDPDVTDYLAPVSAPGDRDPVAGAIVHAGSALEEFRSFDLAGLPADSGWPDALARAAKEAGLSVTQTPEDVCPVIALGGSYDLYLASLSGKQRHEIRRKARRLAEGATVTIRLSEPGELEDDLDAFFALHRSSDGPKGKFMHQDMEAYFRRLARSMSASGRLRLTVLEMDGAPAAMLYGFSDGRTWSLYNSAYDHTKRDAAPGMVLVAETIRAAAEEGCGAFDFLRGSEEYKYRFGAVDRHVVRLTATPG